MVTVKDDIGSIPAALGLRMRDLLIVPIVGVLFGCAFQVGMNFIFDLRAFAHFGGSRPLIPPDLVRAAGLGIAVCTAIYFFMFPLRVRPATLTLRRLGAVVVFAVGVFGAVWYNSAFGSPVFLAARLSFVAILSVAAAAFMLRLRR